MLDPEDHIRRRRNFLRGVLMFIIILTLPFYCLGFFLWGNAPQRDVLPTPTNTALGSQRTATLTATLLVTSTRFATLLPTPGQFLPPVIQPTFFIPPTAFIPPFETLAPTLTFPPTNTFVPTNTLQPAMTATFTEPAPTATTEFIPTDFTPLPFDTPEGGGSELR
jgi:hypothetical protein